MCVGAFVQENHTTKGDASHFGASFSPLLFCIPRHVFLISFFYHIEGIPIEDPILTYSRPVRILHGPVKNIANPQKKAHYLHWQGHNLLVEDISCSCCARKTYKWRNNFWTKVIISPLLWADLPKICKTSWQSRSKLIIIVLNYISQETSISQQE